MSELENGRFIIGFDGTENLNETHCGCRQSSSDSDGLSHGPRAMSASWLLNSASSCDQEISQACWAGDSTDSRACFIIIQTI